MSYRRRKRRPIQQEQEKNCAALLCKNEARGADFGVSIL